MYGCLSKVPFSVFCFSFTFYITFWVNIWGRKKKLFSFYMGVGRFYLSLIFHGPSPKGATWKPLSILFRDLVVRSNNVVES